MLPPERSLHVDYPIVVTDHLIAKLATRVELSAADRVAIAASGSGPILVVGTTRDPATPYRWAEALAEQLESGVLLIRDGDGHTGFQQGNGGAAGASGSR